MVTAVAVLHRPRRDVAGGIGADGSLGHLVQRDFGAVHHHARVERDQAVRRGQQRIDVDFLDPALLGHQRAEAHQEHFERGQIHRLAAAHAFQRLVDLGLLHHAPRQRGVQRRQAERAVLEDLDQLAAGAEQQHRAELRIEAAADDQLVGVLAA